VPEKNKRELEPWFDFLNEFSCVFCASNGVVFDRKINARFSCTCGGAFNHRAFQDVTHLRTNPYPTPP
jgi:hypothetical protein